MQPIDRRCFVRLTALTAVSALATGADIVNASAALGDQAEQRAQAALSSKLQSHEEKDMSTKMNPTTGVRLDLFGPTVEFLTSPQEGSIDFCVLKGSSRQASRFRYTVILTRKTFLLSPVRYRR